MKAMIIEEYGGPQNLKEAEVPDPAPGDDQVLIEIVCAGVNPVDWMIREGLAAEAYPFEFPIILGSDAAGTIAAVGRNVADFAVGEKVFVASSKESDPNGSYAEYIAADAVSVAPIPGNLSFAQAAGVPLAALTAWQALFDFAGLAAGNAVLVHAGAGGVGSFAIQFAKHAGATVLTTASRVNHGYVTELGADVAVDYRAEDVVAAVKATHQGGIDVVLDTVGGEGSAGSLRGAETRRRFGLDRRAARSRFGRTTQGQGRRYRVFRRWPAVARDRRLDRAGAVKPAAIKRYRWDEAARAQVASRAGHVRGKLVLRVRED